MQSYVELLAVCLGLGVGGSSFAVDSTARRVSLAAVSGCSQGMGLFLLTPLVAFCAGSRLCLGDGSHDPETRGPNRNRTEQLGLFSR